MPHKNGNSLIIVLIITGILTLSLAKLSRSIIWVYKLHDLHYVQTKTQFLAFSGITIGSNELTQVPTLSPPSVPPSKEWLYTTTTTMPPYATLDGTIHLIKTPQNTLYAIVKYKNIYRKIASINFQLTPTPQFSALKFL